MTRKKIHNLIKKDMKLAGLEFNPQPLLDDQTEFIAIGVAEQLLEALEELAQATRHYLKLPTSKRNIDRLVAAEEAAEVFIVKASSK